jgi:hypothetical protein
VLDSLHSYPVVWWHARLQKCCVGVHSAKHVDPTQLLRYNIGFASGVTSDVTIKGRVCTSCRGSDKAMKYLNNRFKQKHVKVQNLTLIVSPCPARLPECS